jgi:hypothetical protein
MDQNRDQPGQSNQVSSNARGQQQSKKQWDGTDRRMGMTDRRNQSDRGVRMGGNRMDAEMDRDIDVAEMNEGSSR